MRKRIVGLLVLLGLVVLGTQFGCSLDVSGLPGEHLNAPQIAVDPSHVELCPGEPVTVRWDASGNPEDCERDESVDSIDSCTQASLTSNDPFVDASIGTFELVGEREFFPRRTTQFTIEKRAAAVEPKTRTATALYLEADAMAPDLDVYFLAGDCVGGRAVWQGLNLREVYGQCTRIGQICNWNTRYTITLSDDLAGSEDLGPQGSGTECTDTYNGLVGDLRPALTVRGHLTIDPTLYCREDPLSGELVLPPPMSLSVSISCLPFDEGLAGCIGTRSSGLAADDAGGVGDDDDGRLQFPCGDGICQAESGEDAQICPQDCGGVGPDTTLPEGAGPLGVMVTVNSDSLCWEGPGDQYPVVSAVQSDVLVALLGIGAEPGWLIVDNPRFPGVACWLPEENTDLDLTLDPSALAVFPVPPLPEEPDEPTPPAAPSNLFVSNEVCSQTEYTITLSWFDNADNEDGYRVYYDGDLIATLGPNATSYEYSVPSSSAATYAVEAFNAAGASAQVIVNEDGCLA